MPFQNLLRNNMLSSFKKWRFITSRFSSQAAAHQSIKHLANSNVLGYSIKEVEDISELNLTAIHLEHKKTGAQHLHLASDDANNFFGVTVKTPPPNHTGVPHILEHLTLCGSKRFPCRDPFFNMLNRSLANFMNAFTGPDYTTYAFASQNSQDFQNLLNVYLDAVFYPNLNENDFRQEGWRLEHEDINDPSSKITFKGVVYNEMKGSLSDPTMFYVDKLMNNMFPDNAYRYIFGGDPHYIPELSWKELKKYHELLYHPSNSRFVTYGNLPLEPLLEKIECLVLNNFDKATINTEISDSQGNSKEIRIKCRFDPMAADPDKQTTVSESFLLTNATNTYENFALNILASLLVDGPNSPLYQNLLQSGLGSDYSPFTGYIGYFKQSMFSVGLREISEHDVGKVQDIIQDTLYKASLTGFPDERIQGILHNVELAMKHRTSNFGLNCCMGVNTMWNHGGNPVEAFQINRHFKWLTDKLQSENNFFQKLISDYLLNKPKLTFIMTPSKDFEAEEQEKEKALLESKVKNLSESDKAKIYQQGLELADHQKVTDTSSLPTIRVEDVKRTVDPTVLQFSSRCSIPLLYSNQPTNGVVYFKTSVDTSCLPPDSLRNIPLLCTVLTQMGAGDRDYKKFDQETQLKTGGLGVSFHVSDHLSDTSQFSHKIIFSSHCLQKNIDDMFSLWSDIFNNVHLNDVERFTQLLKQLAAETAQGISSEGHRYAMIRAASSLSHSAELKENTSGISQVTYLKQLAEMENHEELLNNLKELAGILFQNQNQNKMKCSINATPEFMPEALDSLDTSFLKSLNSSSSENKLTAITSKLCADQKSHFILPLPVNFVARSILTVPYCHEDFARLKIVSRLMSSKFLHKEIREKGGAYGGGASLNTGGHFLFYSYRDPNFEKTLNNFLLSVDWVLNSQFSDEDIDEAKLNVFRDMDVPISPGSRGSTFFTSGISDQILNEQRTAIFSCTRSDLINVTGRYLKNSQRIGTAVIGPENPLTSATDSGWTVMSS